MFLTPHFLRMLTSYVILNGAQRSRRFPDSQRSSGMTGFFAFSNIEKLLLDNLDIREYNKTTNTR